MSGRQTCIKAVNTVVVLNRVEQDGTCLNTNFDESCQVRHEYEMKYMDTKFTNFNTKPLRHEGL